MSAARRLPITVIGGFLGAGKTTLLNHWLRHAEGRRLAVLVNDFGALNIDAELIASQAADTLALTNGCVCCQIGDDLSRALWTVTDQAERFDAVVVEASGVSDPWRIAQLGRADPGLSLDGVIVLVDASAALVQLGDPLLADTLARQLRGADLIVVNHVDQADAPTLSAVRDWITHLAPGVPRCETRQAAVPLPWLSGLSLPHGGDDDTTEALERWRHRPLHQHHGVPFDVWSARPDHVFTWAALHAWLAEPPPGLLRLKGLLRSGVADWVELQFAGRHGTLRKAAAPASGAALVAIGLRGQLPVERLEAAFSPIAG